MPHAVKEHTQPRTLAEAAEAGDAAAVGSLLASGAKPDERRDGGATALMRASARGYSDIARALLDAGADPCARRADGFTPLLLATFYGHEEVARLLLERGADATARTRLGITAEAWAASRGFHSLAQLLKEAAPPRTVGPEPEASLTSEASAERAADSINAGGSAAVSETTPARARKTRVTIEVSAAARSAVVAAEDDAALRDDEWTQLHDSTPRRAAPREFQFASPPPRGFLGSWQALVGVALLAVACGIAAVAVWQNSRRAARVGRPAPSASPVAPQAAAPLPTIPADSSVNALPSPTPPPPALMDGALTPGAPGGVILEPYPVGQPLPVQPGTTSPVPALVSESGAQTPLAESPARREPARAATADPSAPRREDERRAEDPRAGAAPREARPAETTQPPASYPSPTPAPSPTPRRRVIQWPPN